MKGCAHLRNHLTLVASKVASWLHNNWWMECVEETMPSTRELRLNFVYPYAPSPSYTLPYHPYTLVIDHQDVLVVGEPVTATGQTYKMLSKEIITALKPLKEYKFNVGNEVKKQWLHLQTLQ